jgi:acetyl esterase/lipase
MKPNSRCTFIKTSSLCLGAIGAGSLPTFASNTAKPAKPLLAPTKTQYLWSENSVNNGPDPAKRPKLEFYIPKTAGDQKRTAVIVCPGGGYGGLAPHEAAPFAQLMAAHSIVGAVLTYRVSPNRYPAPIADALRAMRLICSQAAELNIDPAKIGIMGFSAGGPTWHQQ